MISIRIKKNIILSLFLLISSNFYAQNLTYKIPEEAIYVLSIKGNKLSELVPIKEFDKSSTGKKLFNNLSKFYNNKQFKSIEDFGVDINNTSFYYKHDCDSISYDCVIIPISNISKYEKLLSEEELTRVKKNEKFNLLEPTINNNQLMAWNNEMLLVVIPELNINFFTRDSASISKYGIKNISKYDYYKHDDYSNYDEAEVYSIETKEPSSEYDKEETKESIEVEEQEIASIEDTEYNSDYDSYENNMYDLKTYNEESEIQEELKNKLLKVWVAKYIENTFNKTTESRSILNDKNYLRSTDDNASITFYLKGLADNYFQNLYGFYDPSLTSIYKNIFKVSKGYNWKLYFDKKDIKMTTNAFMDNEIINSYKKMLKHKPNKNFTKYINEDYLTGFISMSLGTEEYLNAYGDFIKKIFLNSKYSDEVTLTVDFLSTIIDQKAIAKVIKGDGLILFNDITKKEITYKTYEYDEETYESKEIEKTKLESIPEFLMMFSSDDTKLIESLFKYGIKKEILIPNKEIYTLSNSEYKFSFDTYFTIKNGIIFCGNSKEDINNIYNDTFKSKLSKEPKKILLKNNISMFFNPKKLVNKIPKENFGSYISVIKLNDFFDNAGIMYFKGIDIKDDCISAEFKAEIPEDQENSLKYFINIIDSISEM